MHAQPSQIEPAVPSFVTPTPARPGRVDAVAVAALVDREENDGSWSRHVSNDGATARLTSIGCELAVDEIYKDPLAA